MIYSDSTSDMFHKNPIPVRNFLQPYTITFSTKNYKQFFLNSIHFIPENEKNKILTHALNKYPRKHVID